MRKGITPVIAIVMLVLVTVGIAGVSYSWFSGIFSSQTKKFISIPAGGAYCSGGEIKVYALNNGDTALTASDIIVAQVDGVDVKGTPFFGNMDSGLVGWWKFDEGAGATATDSSGSGNTGTLTNMDPLSDWVTGRFGKALDFDGENDFVAANGNSLNIAGDLTVSGWFRTTENNEADIGLIGVWGPTAATQNYLLWLYQGDVKFDTRGTGDTLTWTNGLSSLIDGNWHHLAGTVTGTTRRIYFDGVEKASDTGNALVSGTGALQMGTYNSRSQSMFNGAIDEVKIYNKANSDVNIQPSSSGLVINYPALQGGHTIRIGTSSGIAETVVTCG